jgi:plastocyanin
LDLQAQIYEFFPEVLTIKAGDTVVWGATDIHTITFNPLPPDPEPILPEPQEVGPPLLLLNPAILLSVKPTGIYDPSQYFNSGLIGLATGGGTAWSLTFDEPGSYEYYCALHKELGMEGRIVVLPR